MRKTSKRNKHKNSIEHLSEYWSRKSVHIRLLPQMYKEVKKFAIDNEISIQGLTEYFWSRLLDGDNDACLMLKEYKRAVSKNEQITNFDVKDIIKAIEESSPFDNDDS